MTPPTAAQADALWAGRQDAEYDAHQQSQALAQSRQLEEERQLEQALQLSLTAAAPTMDTELEAVLAMSRHAPDALASAEAAALGAALASAPTSAGAVPAYAAGRAALARAAPAPAPAPAPAAPPKADPEAVADLMAFGFDEAVVLDALASTNGDVDAAANLLIDGPGG